MGSHSMYQRLRSNQCLNKLLTFWTYVSRGLELVYQSVSVIESSEKHRKICTVECKTHDLEQKRKF
jgi:hypothetical protein